MINHIDDQGYLWVKSVGGWDVQVLVGQRVEILSDSGLVSGVVGRRAIHLIRGDDSEKALCGGPVERQREVRGAVEDRAQEHLGVAGFNGYLADE